MADERHSNAKTQAGGDLPVWLRGVPLPARPSSQSPRPPEAASAASAPLGELPDWLRGLQDTAPTSDADDVPFEPSTGAEQLPNWLASLASEAANELTIPSAEQAPARAAPDVGVPDWLRELSSEPDAQPVAEAPFAGKPESQSDESFDWLGLSESAPVEPPAAPQPPPPAKPPTRTPLRMPIGATDWLRSLGEENDPAQTPAPTNRDQPPPLPPPAPVSDDEGIPAWLRDIPSDEIARDLADINEAPARQEQDVGAVQGREADFDMPSWLAPDGGAAQSQPSADDAPDWLRGAAAPPSSDNDDADRTSAADWFNASDWSTGTDTPDTPPAAERPAWLRDAADASSPANHFSADDAHDDPPTPSWLGDARDDRSASLPTERQDESLDLADEPGLPSWLRAPDTNEPARSSSPAANDDLPAWLRIDDDQPAEPDARSEPQWSRDSFDVGEQSAGHSVAENQADADLPDWLRVELPSTPEGLSTPSLRRSAAETDVPSRLGADAPTNTPPDGDDLPSWLRADAHDAADVVEQSAPLPMSEERPAEPPAVHDELDWLHTLQETPSSPAQPANQNDDLPDWMRSDASDVTPPNLPLPPARDDVLPDWLHDDASASGRNGGLPTWLQGADRDGPQQPTAPEPGDETSTANRSNLPPWLRDEGQATAAEATEAQRGNDFLGLGGADLPSWLRSADAPPSAEPVSAAAAAGETYTDWLGRLRTQQDEDVESEGALAEPTDAFSTLKRPTYAVKPERVEAIALLQRLVAEPFPTRAVPAAEVIPVRQSQGLERILYLLLLVAMIVGLVVPQLTSAFQGSIVAPDADRLTETINGLGENDIVLVAYEWDARRRGELAPLEQSVINHLAERKVKFVFMSTDLQGTFLSYDARDRLLNQFGYRMGGLDYILLGYKPGGELALRQLAQNLPAVLSSDFAGADANESAVALDVATGKPRLTSVNDFAAVVVMADDPQDVQGWMEQVRPQMATTKPFILLMPTETMPVVQPYLRMPGVLALAGRQGALAYEQRQSGEAATKATMGSGQIPFAVASFIVLVLLGALVGGILRALQRPRSA